MRQMLCSIFINDLRNGSEYIFAEFADDGELCRALETLDYRAVILDKLEE